MNLGAPVRPTEYIVRNRAAAVAQGVLRDRFWNPLTTAGPLMLSCSKNVLKRTGMSERCHGGNSPIGIRESQSQGFYTTGVSDCSVIAIAEWMGDLWGRYYFEHVVGSHVTDTIKNEAKAAFDNSGPNRYAVVAQWYGGTAFNSADELFELLGVRPENRTYYRSNKSGMTFGVNFIYGTFGEFDV